MRNALFFTYMLINLNQVFAQNSSIKIEGELKKWHKVTLVCEGPETSEDAEENPFLHYRLNVLFKHAASGKEYLIPGYYAADGKAAHSSANQGNIWKVHFAPDETGD